MFLRPYFSITASILLTSFAQLTLKWALGHACLDVLKKGYQPLLSQQCYLPLLALLIGIGCYVLSMLFWLIALAKIPLSRAYPLLALSYAIVYLLATHLPQFQEAPAPLASLGVALILLGVTLTSTSAKKGRRL